jgi:flagellar biosynthetic protein FliR
MDLAATGWTTQMMTVAALVWVRVAVALFGSPLFGSTTPTVFKVLLSLFVSVAFALSLAGNPAVAASVLREPWPVLMVSEAFVGLTLGFGLQAAFAAFALAGKVLDIQIGLGIAGTYDPLLRTQTPLATTLSLVATVVFFLIDGHHGLMRALLFSFENVPIGASLSPAALPAVVAQFGAMFTIAVTVVAPVILGLLLVEAGLSVVSRVMPQMNIIFVGVPIRVFAGLGLLILLAPYLRTPVATATRTVFEFFGRVSS